MNKERIQSIDWYRGLVMVIMTLDHCREFLHYPETVGIDALDLDHTTPSIFLTRWITHFCAPVFVLLTGLGAFLYGHNKSKKQVFNFLFLRGLWLIAIEIIVIGPVWLLGFNVIYLQVIWVLGLSMIALSVLQYLPLRYLFLLGLMLIFLHNLLDNVSIGGSTTSTLLWSIVHEHKEFYFLDHTFLLVVAYPLVPWLGVMMVGYAMGALYTPGFETQLRKKILLLSGILALLLFLFIRLCNSYGDLHPWAQQQTWVYTFLDFIKTEKYPPSISFILMTTGPALILLALSERVKSPASKVLTTFGKVPFLFYVLHIPLISLLAHAIFVLSGHGLHEFAFDGYRNGFLPYGSGHSLWVVYLTWSITLIVLYFPCRAYARFKSQHHYWYLSFI
jgi:uncharacterized membrane protein